MSVSKATGESTSRDTPEGSASGILAGLSKRCRTAWARFSSLAAGWLARRLRAAGHRPDLELQRLTLDKELDYRNSGETERLLKALEGHPFQRQLILVRQIKGYQTAFMVRALCRESRNALFENADRSRAFALLAADIAEHLDSQCYPQGVVGDLRALAWLRIGYAERRASDLPASEDAFLEAAAALEQGSGDKLERGQYLHGLGMLRMDQGRLEEAIGLTERAAELYEEIGNWHSLGKVTLDQGLILRELGEFERACKKFIAASLFLDRGLEPRLVLAVLHNLALCFSDLGRGQAALAILREGEPLYEAVGSRSEVLMRLWLEGRILASLGWAFWREAAARFRQARRGFLEQGWVIDAARTSLEEALISDPVRRRHLVRELLTEMLPTLRVRGLRQEALAALTLLGNEVREGIGSAAIQAALRTLDRERKIRD